MSNRPELRPPTDGRKRVPAENILPRLFEELRPRAGPTRADAPRSLEFPELDCVRNWLPVGAIAAAERGARAMGVTADRVLITSGVLTEDAYVSRLAQSLGLAFEPLEAARHEAWLVSEDRLVDASAAGLLPLMDDDELAVVVAPRGVATRRLCTLVNTSSEWRRRIRLTTGEQLARFVRQHASAALGQRAAFGLLTDQPELSAAPRHRRWSWRVFAAAALGLSAAIAAPGLMATAFNVVSPWCSSPGSRCERSACSPP